MKRFFLLFIGLSAFFGATAQNWTVLNSGTNVDLYAVHFPDPNTGYIAGDNGVLLKTINAGTDWTLLDAGMGISFFSVYFMDTNKGWACGQYGEVLRTYNGGTNWDPQVLSVYVTRLNSVFFTGFDTGYVVGGDYPNGGGIIEKTTNGGFSFPDPLMNVIPSNGLSSVHFPDQNTGYVVGDSGTIQKTTDAGTNWVFQSSGTISDLYSVYFTSTDTGYSVGDNGIILKTTNGGTDWMSIFSGTSSGLKSVYFADQNTGYAVGDDGTILVTLDGGATWATEFSGTTNDLHSVFFTDENTGYAVGDTGLVLKTTNGGGVGINQNSFALKPLDLYPNPAHGFIMIEIREKTENSLLSVSDVNGIELIECQVTGAKNQVDINDLPRGVYIVRLTNEMTVRVGKFIKE